MTIERVSGVVTWSGTSTPVGNLLSDAVTILTCFRVPPNITSTFQHEVAKCGDSNGPLLVFHALSLTVSNLRRVYLVYR